MATEMKTKNNETTIDYDELLPLKEVADRCNIGMRLLREAIGRREIRVVKFTSKIWRVRESDRLAWVERKSKGSLTRTVIPMEHRQSWRCRKPRLTHSRNAQRRLRRQSLRRSACSRRSPRANGAGRSLPCSMDRQVLANQPLPAMLQNRFLFRPSAG